MNTNQIQYCLELSHTLNFNKAAENLFISQPTLSYQIKSLEDEIGFQIFNRNGKSVSLTPAGAQFCTSLKGIYADLTRAIELGQNFSSQYQDDIKIYVPNRTAFHLLPKVIKEFQKTNPTVSITPIFKSPNGLEDFLRQDIDIYFCVGDRCKKLRELKEYHLYDSHFYLITKKNDPLSTKDLITISDLENRTLMIGGGSPPVLRALQQKIISAVPVHYFNSHDHDTTLTNVEADKGVCISPGLLNDRSKEFAWIPFDTKDVLPCYLYIHESDQRKIISDFLRVTINMYKNNDISHL